MQVSEGKQELDIGGGKKRTIATYTWETESDPVGLAFLCHGYAERLRPYYDELAQALIDQGFKPFGHDHTGHGFSDGERAQVADVAEYLNPLLEHSREMKNKYPNIPLFLVGHSMGGMISILAALDQKGQEENLFAGLVLVGPLVVPDPDMASPLKVLAAKVAARVVPWLAVPGGIEPKTVTSDQKWIEYIENDGHRWHGGFKAGHANVLNKTIQEFVNDFPKLQLPMLVIQGALDKIVAPIGAKKVFEGAGSSDKHLEMLDDSLHNPLIEREEIRKPMIANIADWIKKRTT